MGSHDLIQATVRAILGQPLPNEPKEMLREIQVRYSLASAVLREHLHRTRRAGLGLGERPGAFR